MKQFGIPLPHTRKSLKKHRSRERMPREGILSQIDASSHAWFENRAPKSCLHGCIDDATSKVQSLFFTENECLISLLSKLPTHSCLASSKGSTIVSPLRLLILILVGSITPTNKHVNNILL
jgi:hypothetical protein